ncbi:MipA/OmpV family protein [Sphingomicrobium sediminis]|uniref:MipA/OmpV family protein n=1 Tax=Sphingomicrobium sediminis TaxID=2950949 RepID=A0A9X2J272_9SPHN|nr:MipA/OmpV family protein [Sphingomicrobium sediminis]MCM8557978.1 MipA/OmpV family protein [Sphingomicrobium sediminis]
MRIVASLIASLVVLPGLAAAQERPSAPEAALPDGPPPAGQRGDSYTIGAGIIYLPDYQGSDDYRIIPGGAFRADIGDIELQTKGLKLYAELMPDSDEQVSFTAGTIVGVRFGRDGVEDPVVDQLDNTGTAIEVGGFAGISISGITNPYDNVTARIEVVRDVNGAHDSFVVTPAIDLSTPLSRATFVSLGFSLDIVGDNYADTYFGVTPAEAAEIPELAAYDPDGGGVKSWGATLVVGHSLEGDIRGGWSLFGLAGYSRLLGDFAASPLVAERGSADQFIAGGGIGYSF